MNSQKETANCHNFSHFTGHQRKLFINFLQIHLNGFLAQDIFASCKSDPSNIYFLFLGHL